jgi:hypothetical protein
MISPSRTPKKTISYSLDRPLTEAVIYATLAFRRVYGGSLSRTLLKEAAIGLIYATAAGVGFVVMIYWVAIVA